MLYVDTFISIFGTNILKYQGYIDKHNITLLFILYVRSFLYYNILKINK